jgi:hypothetical protein
MQRCFDAHRAMLEAALTAAAQRTRWSAAPETPSDKLHGASAKAPAAFTPPAPIRQAGLLDVHGPGAGRVRDGRFAGRLLSEKGWDA